MGYLCTQVMVNPEQFEECLSEVAVPESLCSAYIRPNVHETVCRMSRRFNPKVQEETQNTQAMETLS